MWWCSRPDGAWQKIQAAQEIFPYGCGPCAHELAMAALCERTPSQTNMQAIQARDAQGGHFSQGQTIADVFWDFQAFPTFHTPAGIEDTIVPDLTAGYNGNGYGAADLRNALAAVGSTGAGAVIIEVGAAYNLPGNEPGVHFHFVALLAYDSVADKALVGNGDVTGRGLGPYACDWVSIAQIAAALPVGMVIIRPKSAIVPPPPPPPGPNIGQAEADISQAEQELANATSSLR